MKHLVLVVDDEPAIVATLCAVLKAHGYNAMGATSGYEAITKIAGSCPDLLLSDVMMPGMNGFETGLRVKELCPKCRLLFFTGYADVLGLARELQNKGHFFEVLLKPIHPALLLEKVKATLAGAPSQASAAGES